MKTKTPSSSIVTSRKIVMPEQINTNGTLFGGILMSWMDKLALMCGQRYAELGKVVTANIDNIRFLSPLTVGDHVVLTAAVDYVGHSSMEIRVEVEKEEFVEVRRHPHALAYFTFVALDAHGKPTEVPRLLPQTRDEMVRYQQGRIRVRLRQRFWTWLVHRSSLLGGPE